MIRRGVLQVGAVTWSEGEFFRWVGLVSVARVTRGLFRCVVDGTGPQRHLSAHGGLLQVGAVTASEGDFFRWAVAGVCGDDC